MTKQASWRLDKVAFGFTSIHRPLCTVGDRGTIGTGTGIAIGALRGIPVGTDTGIAIGALRGIPVGTGTGIAIGTLRGIQDGLVLGMDVGSFSFRPKIEDQIRTRTFQSDEKNMVHYKRSAFP
jgi:hypothetical protein